MNSTDLNSNRVVVVSGGMGYLGQEIVVSLLTCGFKVAFLYNSKKEDYVKDFVLSNKGEGVCRGYKCDLLKEEDVKKVLIDIESGFGSIYAGISVAGCKPYRKSFLKTTQDELMTQVKNNFVTAFNFIKEVSFILNDKKEGVIVGITTVGVKIEQNTKFISSYLSAKYALQGVLVSLKDELLSSGVRVYSVAPGFMEGGMNGDIPKAFLEIVRAKSKTGKLTCKSNVAKKVSYLCCDDSKKEKELTFVVAEEFGII